MECRYRTSYSHNLALDLVRKNVIWKFRIKNSVASKKRAEDSCLLNGTNPNKVTVMDSNEQSLAITASASSVTENVQNNPDYSSHVDFKTDNNMIL